MKQAAPCTLGADVQLAYTVASLPSSGQVCTGVALWFVPSSARPALVFAAGRHTGDGTNFVLLPDDRTVTGFQPPLPLPGVPSGSFSGVAVDGGSARLLLAGDDGASGVQPSLLYQLPSTSFGDLQTSTSSSLPLLWTQQQHTLVSARGCAWGTSSSVGSQVLLALSDGRLAVYSGVAWVAETLLSPVPHLPAVATPGVDCTPTAVCVSCNPHTGSVAVGIRQKWATVAGAQTATGTVAVTPCTGGFRPSALLRGPDCTTAVPVLLPTSMQAVGVYVGPVLAPGFDDVVVVGSSDNTSTDLASVPLLFPNGDPSRAIALTTEPVQGRAVAVADISGNGLADIFIVGTGAYHYLLLQRAAGVFVQQRIPTGAPAGTYRGVAIGRVYGNPHTVEVVLSSVGVSPGCTLSFVQPCAAVGPRPVWPVDGSTALTALPLGSGSAYSTAPSRTCKGVVQAPLFWGVVAALLVLLVVAAVLAGVFGRRAANSHKQQLRGAMR